VTFRRSFVWAWAAAMLAAFLAYPMVSPADALPAGQIARVNAIVKSAMAAQHLAGVEIAIGRNGRVLFTRGYGLRDRARNLPVTAATVFPIGSITKQFTATAVMLLVQQGKVNLDAKVALYLPSAPHASEITVRELADQTSGLHDYLENKPLLVSIETGKARTHHTPEQLVDLLRGMPLLFKPGTKWAYSNTNYLMLGMLVAKVSGTPFASYLTANVLEPQGLDAIKWLLWSVPRGSDVSRGYSYANGSYALVPNYDMTWGGAAGALASTADDLVQWDGAYFGGRVLTPQSVRIATTPPHGIAAVASKDPKDNIIAGYAFGWAVGEDEGRAIIWHNGGIIGARAMNAVFPNDGLEIVVLTNATEAKPESISLRIARMLYAQ